MGSLIHIHHVQAKTRFSSIHRDINLFPCTGGIVPYSFHESEANALRTPLLSHTFVSLRMTYRKNLRNTIPTIMRCILFLLVVIAVVVAGLPAIPSSHQIGKSLPCKKCMTVRADTKVLGYLENDDIPLPSCNGDSNCQRWLDRRLNWLWSQEQNQFFATMGRRDLCVKGKILYGVVYDSWMLVAGNRSLMRLCRAC